MKRGAVNMPVNMLVGLFATLLTLPAHAAEPLNPADASAWLQRMSDAARRATYAGVFVVQHGSGMQTMSIVNRPVGAAKESRLAAMDGIEREIRCSQTGSISRVMQDGQIWAKKK